MTGSIREYLSGNDDLKVRNAVIDIIAKRLIGRKIMPSWNVGEGAQDVGFDNVTTDMAVAEIIAKGGRFPRNIMAEARTTKGIPKIGEGFDIPREDILTTQSLGKPVNTRWATAAGRKIAEREDGIIINGDSTWGIAGLLTSPGNTQAAVATWSTTATAKPYEDVNNAIGKIDAKGLEPRALILHPTNYAEARSIWTSTASNYSHLEKIATLLPGGMNAILKSDSIAEGTALVVDTSEDVSQLAIAEELNFENQYVMERQAYAYNAWERLVPLIYRTDGQCVITGV